MGSQTRLQIITEALSVAGRDMGIRSLAEGMLNRHLRHMAVEYKYPILRKTGTPITLLAGSTTASLPPDYGAGMDNMLFGPDSLPLYELSADEFVQSRGFQPANVTTGMPQRYMVENKPNNTGLFRFNSVADINYSFTPIYFYIPADLPVADAGGDASFPWFPDDDVLVQAMVWKVLQYTKDVDAPSQYTLYKGMLKEYREGAVPMGGGANRIMLSPTVFKPRRF